MTLHSLLNSLKLQFVYFIYTASSKLATQNGRSRIYGWLNTKTACIINSLIMMLQLRSFNLKLLNQKALTQVRVTRKKIKEIFDTV